MRLIPNESRQLDPVPKYPQGKNIHVLLQ